MWVEAAVEKVAEEEAAVQDRMKVAERTWSGTSVPGGQDRNAMLAVPNASFAARAVTGAPAARSSSLRRPQLLAAQLHLHSLGDSHGLEASQGAMAVCDVIRPMTSSRSRSSAGAMQANRSSPSVAASYRTAGRA